LQLNNGRLLSWSKDATLRLWDTGIKPLPKLKEQSEDINGVLVLKDRCILSRTEEDSKYIWDREGKLLFCTQGNLKGPRDIMQLSNHRLVISFYTMMQIRSVDGNTIAEMQGHTEGPIKVKELNNGWLISWVQHSNPHQLNLFGNDYTIRMWDEEGKPIAVLKE